MLGRSTHTPQRTASFTVVEMLVIISIVSLLSSIAFTGLQEARAMARDARRMTLLNDLRLSLEQYYDEYGFYPVNLVGTSISAESINDNPVYPFFDAGVSNIDSDIGSTLEPNTFMLPLMDAGLWNAKTIEGDFNISGYQNASDWPWQQPDGTYKHQNNTPLCGGSIRYYTGEAWYNLNPQIGPQTYFMEIAFERKKSFDAFWSNDLSGLQFDGGATPGANDNEFSRTALQTECPWGSSMFVFIHHCAGSWQRRSNGYENADDDNSIPMHDCYVDGEKVDWEYAGS